jgi:hypothetical protein
VRPPDLLLKNSLGSSVAVSASFFGAASDLSFTFRCVPVRDHWLKIFGKKCFMDSLEVFAKWMVLSLLISRALFCNACWERAINSVEIYWVIWGSA